MVAEEGEETGGGMMLKVEYCEKEQDVRCCKVKHFFKK